MCPVRVLTPEVRTALTWFEETHQLVFEQGIAYWRRTALPHAGGIGDQDARLLAELDVLRLVHDAIAIEALERAAHEREIVQWRRDRNRRRDDEN